MLINRIPKTLPDHAMTIMSIKLGAIVFIDCNGFDIALVDISKKLSYKTQS